MSYIIRNMFGKRLRSTCMTILMLVIFSCLDVSGQTARRERKMQRNAALKEAISDTTKPVLSDSLIAVRDSIHRADSIHKADSLDLLTKSSLDAPAFTAARDSIIEDFSNGKQVIHYYGDVTVTYGNMKKIGRAHV